MEMPKSIPALADRVTTEAEAYELLEQLRWGNQPVCPHCAAGNPMFIRPMNGETRRTRTGSMSARRVWKCRQCRKQFSVLTGTIFHGSKIPVRTWLFVIFEMCASKNGVAAREIERKYDLTPKTAWFMLHRIREAMKREPLVGMLTGTIVADETWIGGRPMNRHGWRHNKGVQGMTDKQPVVSLISKDTGEVRSFMLPRVTRHNIDRVLTTNMHPDAELHTDSSSAYLPVGRKFADHQSVNHYEGEYVRGDVSTNAAEGYFSQLKRSIDGTHHHVSVKHLERYLAEHDFRYSTRKVSDSHRATTLLGQVGGRRLSYRPLAGS